MKQVFFFLINSYVARCDILIRSKVFQHGVGPCEAPRGEDGAKKFALPYKTGPGWGKTKPFRAG